MNTSFNPNAAYGRALLDLAGSVVPAFGDVHVVVSASDTAKPNYQKLQDVMKPSNGFVRFWNTLNDAYDACTTNNNDVILLDANSTHNITPIAWSKSRIHVIGMDGGERLLQQGSKVQSATTATTAYVLKVTGVRNSFRNIKFIQSSTEATALNVVQFGGEGNLWKNCSFVFGVADNLDLTTATEALMGEDSGTFIDCTFGLDTLLTSAARSVMTIDQVSAWECKSNIFVRPRFFISSSEAGAQFIKMAASGDALFTNVFEDAGFYASVDSAGGVALTRAVSTANGFVKGTLLFDYPKTFNVTDFGTNGTNNDGLLVRSPLMSNTDLVGIAPIAT